MTSRRCFEASSNMFGLAVLLQHVFFYGSHQKTSRPSSINLVILQQNTTVHRTRSRFPTACPAREAYRKHKETQRRRKKEDEEKEEILSQPINHSLIQFNSSTNANLSHTRPISQIMQGQILHICKLAQ